MKMNNLFVGIIVLVNLLSAGTSLGHITREKTFVSSVETANRQIRLGSASIYGNGTHSQLNATAEKFLGGIPLQSETETVDFYIEYDMVCNGLVDTGSIGLGIAINGKNVSDPKNSLVITGAKKNGTFLIENVQVKRRDVLSFGIAVVYLSVNHPNGGNWTSAYRLGVILSKSMSRFSWIASHPILSRWMDHRGKFSLLNCL
jgi:hypothetical protein